VKTMAEEILTHSQIGRDENGQYCKGCGHRLGYAAERELHHRASAHVAAALSAAGFGPVREAAERQDSCPVRLMDGRNEIRCWLEAGHEGDCR